MSPAHVSTLERIEPRLGSDEAAYRRHFLAIDTAHATAAAWIVIALSLLVLAFEFIAFQRELVGTLVGLRVAFFCVCAARLVIVGRAVSPQKHLPAARVF
jgi:hypothetical protein